MDVLSDVLRVVRLTGSVFFIGEFSAPWSMDEPDADQLAASSIPDAERLVLFHILTEGDGFFEAQELPSVHLTSGDVIVFPHGDRHRISSQLGMHCQPLNPAMPLAAAGRDLDQLVLGGGGKTTRFICGYLNCDQKFNPLLGALPNILVMRSRDAYSVVEAIDRDGLRPAQVAHGSSYWLSTTLEYMVHEAREGRPGSQAMLGRLTELMFVEMLRQYMRQLPADHSGWLVGLNDRQVGRALRSMHDQPERNWTVDELAREAGMSRSGFAERFTELIGDPPMKYLTAWRIQLAKHLLREENSVANVAGRVGYDSEAAFNRAFKRSVGIPPASWRKVERTTSPSGSAANTHGHRSAAALTEFKAARQVLS